MDKRRSARRPWTIVLLIVLICCALAYGVASIGTVSYTHLTLPTKA